MGAPRFPASALPPICRREQVQERPLDHRTTSTLGVVPYQLLTGDLPFQASTSYSMIYQIIHSVPTEPSFFAETCPKPLDAVVARAMAKDVEALPDLGSTSPMISPWRRASAPRCGRRKFDLPSTETGVGLISHAECPFFQGFPRSRAVWEVLGFAQWDRVPARP